METEEMATVEVTAVRVDKHAPAYQRVGFFLLDCCFKCEEFSELTQYGASIAPIYVCRKHMFQVWPCAICKDFHVILDNRKRGYK